MQISFKLQIQRAHNHPPFLRNGKRIHRSSSFTAQRSAIHRGTGSKSLQGLRLVPPRVDTNPLISFYKASSRDPWTASGYGKAGHESRTTHRYRPSRISSQLDIQEDIDRRYRFPLFPLVLSPTHSSYPSFSSPSLSLSLSVASFFNLPRRS